jgi:hypothetical protein
MNAPRNPPNPPDVAVARRLWLQDCARAVGDLKGSAKMPMPKELLVGIETTG